MQARTTLLSAAALGFALLVGPARAADLPKEGKYKGTASGYGTYKSIPVGKERVLTISDENNLTLTDGFSPSYSRHSRDWLTGVA